MNGNQGEKHKTKTGGCVRRTERKDWVEDKQSSGLEEDLKWHKEHEKERERKRKPDHCADQTCVAVACFHGNRHLGLHRCVTVESLSWSLFISGNRHCWNADAIKTKKKTNKQNNYFWGMYKNMSAQHLCVKEPSLRLCVILKVRDFVWEAGVFRGHLHYNSAAYFSPRAEWWKLTHTNVYDKQERTWVYFLSFSILTFTRETGTSQKICPTLQFFYSSCL